MTPKNKKVKRWFYIDIRKALDLMRDHQGVDHDLASIPTEQTDVYDMLCRADSIGVFQVESRAQMNMLPRLKPARFYDLVIEVAIVRPGPIQGDMVHPYLRRREGKEDVVYPKPELEKVLGKTLGVPLFQEQAMRVAIECAGFTASEADQLRRAMATFKFTGGVSHFKDKLVGVRLRNRSGQVLSASEAGFRAAILASDVYRKGDDSASLLNRPRPDAWPITSTSFVLLDARPKGMSEADWTARFVYWCFMHGDELTRGTGFAPLPSTVQARLAAASAEAIKPSFHCIRCTCQVPRASRTPSSRTARTVRTTGKRGRAAVVMSCLGFSASARRSSAPCRGASGRAPGRRPHRPRPAGSSGRRGSAPRPPASP